MRICILHCMVIKMYYTAYRYVSMCKPNSIRIDKDVILDACGEMETLFCGAMVHFNGPGSSVAFGVKCS